MNIRLATNLDIDQLIKMRWDFTNDYSDCPIESNEYEGFYLECREFLTNAIQSNRWYVWVADLEGQLISHVYIELIHKVPRPGRKTNRFTYMTNVYTLPEYRGKGVGSQILKKIETWSRKNEYEFIIVWPSEWSIDFYERNGYQQCKEPMELLLD